MELCKMMKSMIESCANINYFSRIFLISINLASSNPIGAHCTKNVKDRSRMI
jgi:hypothetical protein